MLVAIYSCASRTGFYNVSPKDTVHKGVHTSFADLDGLASLKEPPVHPAIGCVGLLGVEATF